MAVSSSSDSRPFSQLCFAWGPTLRAAVPSNTLLVCVPLLVCLTSTHVVPDEISSGASTARMHTCQPCLPEATLY